MGGKSVPKGLIPVTAERVAKGHDILRMVEKKSEKGSESTGRAERSGSFGG